MKGKRSKEAMRYGLRKIHDKRITVKTEEHQVYTKSPLGTKTMKAQHEQEDITRCYRRLSCTNETNVG